MVEVKMGNHRFRLSDMMPNASWFYKLKHINNKPHRHPLTKNTAAAAAAAAAPPPNQPLLPNRASYYFPSNYSPLHPSSTHLPPDPPPANPPPAALLHHHHLHSSSCSCRGSHHSASCTCNNNNNIVVGSELLLRPILTKPAQAAKRTNYKQGPHDPEPTTHKSSPARKAVPHRLRGSARTLTMSSPTIHRKVRLARAAAAAAARRIRTRGILYESCFPVVKSSSDPEGDFRESMMEMILENQLTSSKDLEDLLACYLSLNSIHYHHIIVNVFQQIWSDITNFIS